ncbi:MAG: hypothetical protein GX417_06085 [Clostridiales bacterium]|nr:hypothetical protein [Clostridiales bacterium]
MRGSEGYGINYADKNGYMNSDSLPLRDDYILFMGSSHLEGLQVMQDQNMVTLLNNMIDTHARTVYNMGTAGYDLPLIIEGFQAGIEEFPDSSAIVIELSQMAYDSDEIQQALVQTHYDPADSGDHLVQALGTSRRLRNDTLSILPVISLLRQQFESIYFGFQGAFGIQATVSDHANDVRIYDENESDDAFGDGPADDAVVNPQAFFEALDQAFALLRAEYHNPIILLYHPRVLLQTDGTAKISRDKQYYDDYLSACENNDIYFLDVGDAFLRAYESDYSLPYGFNNTTMGSGHLNQTGHRIVAEELYKALQQIQSKEKQ